MTQRNFGLIILGCRRSLYFLPNETKAFALNKAVDSAFLCELTIFQVIDSSSMFTNFELDQEFPRLNQLCIWLENELQEVGHAIEKRSQFRHKTLSMLIISTNVYNKCIVNRICALCVLFPNSSINWWLKWHRLHMVEITDRIKLLSCDLPVCVIGRHFVGFDVEGLVKTYS